jgi:hypothetical protein
MVLGLAVVQHVSENGLQLKSELLKVGHRLAPLILILLGLPNTYLLESWFLAVYPVSVAHCKRVLAH